MNRRHLPLRLLPLALTAVLAACATTPPHPLPAKSASAPAPAETADSAPPAVAATPAPATGDIWDRLRGSFALADCDADPAVLSWAHRYTRNPQRFEEEVRSALPKLTYVQQVAASHDVPGEFALLPWIESGFRPILGRRGHAAAGMWQIMPATARAMGLRVDRHYDARLDVQASADAVMKLLSRYHDEFDDWRVADVAYNAGELNARRLLDKHGQPPAAPVIPTWPVRHASREHLTRLLAMACVVREPERFHVSLPTLTPEQHLVSVPLPRSMPLALAADHAGMSLSNLKDLNAAFRNGIADAGAASYLMMPVGHAQQFRDALLNQAASTDADRLPGTIMPTGMGSAETADADADAAPSSARRPRTHRVKAGETLWQLARHYAVSVPDLERWNHLQGGRIKPGQMLRLGASTH